MVRIKKQAEGRQQSPRKRARYAVKQLSKVAPGTHPAPTAHANALAGSSIAAAAFIPQIKSVA